MISPSDIATLAELGVTASMQPAFDAAWGSAGELYETRLGPARSQQMNPLGSLSRAGVPLAFGTDAPVTPLAGWATVAHAVRHSRVGERLDVAVAFAAATVGGHWAARDDDSGVIRTGARADLAVWDVEPSQLDDVGLPRLAQDQPLPRCWLTMAGGRVVFPAVVRADR